LRLYATFALLGAFGSSGVGYTKVMGTLFTRHRGKALAVFGAESTVALALLPVLTNAFIAHFGWRGAYLAYGLIMFSVAPVIYFVIHEPGMRTAAGRPTDRPPPPMEGMTSSQFLRDRTFWLLVLLAVVSGGLYQGMLTHVVAAMTDKGFSATTAADVLAISTLTGLVGTLLGGFAVDHFRTARPVAAFALLSAAGAAMFAVVNVASGGVPLLIAAMAAQGAATAALRPIASYLQTRFFGLRAFGEANAIQIVFQGTAMAITPPLFGIIYERQGSYALVYWLMIGGGVLSACLYLVLGPYRYATSSRRASP